MTNFIRGYLALAVDDPKRSWESLTPAFQKDSGFGQYKKFWNSVSSSEAIDVKPDPASGEISYVHSYVRNGQPQRDDVTLTLVLEGSRYRIDAEA